MNAPKVLKKATHWMLRKGLEPVSLFGITVTLDNPNVHMGYEDALMAYEQAKDRFDGIGYVVMDHSENFWKLDGDIVTKERNDAIVYEDEFVVEESYDFKALDDEETGEPGIVGISLVNCRDPATGEVSPWAEYFLHLINSPSSITPSGTGFTVFCLGSISDDPKKVTGQGIDGHSLFEIDLAGPRFFPLTGEWLEDYPLEMGDRTRELNEIMCLWTPINLKKDRPQWIHESDLPHLDMLKVIDVGGFTKLGDELVGHHPLFDDGTYLKVNPASNIWYFFHKGDLILGDAWIWLAAESGAVGWMDILPDTLTDSAKVQKVKEFAVSKSYFTEDDLFPERKMIRDALQVVADLKGRALSDPGLPFEPQNIEALAIVKISNLAEYERVKGSWKDKISIRELNKSVEEQVRKIRASNILRSEPETMHTNDAESLMYEKKPISEQILDIILKSDDSVELWHTSEGNGYLSLCYSDDHFEHHALKAKATKKWLSSLYHAETDKVANSSALNDAITVLEGRAMNGPSYPTYVRVAYADDALYIDLGDDTWEAVKITASGWDIVKDVPVKFRRGNGLLSLPSPEKGGSIDDLRSILNIKDRKIWLLVKGWLIGSISPNGPYAILAIVGEQGSAKTLLAKILRSIIDPNDLPARRPPRSTEDLMITASNNWIVGFDNLSRIKDWLSDDLCNLATGGGLSKRELYSDANETIIRVCRPIILNGIDDIVTRQDLLDRGVVAMLSRISDDERRPEKELLKEFECLHPKILGALLDAAVIGMRNKDSIKLDSLPRMADFAMWVAAALGDEGQEFLEAYKENRDCAVKDALEGDPIVVNLKNFLDRNNGKWRGTATELLAALNADKKPSAGLPRAPNALSVTLRRLAPALRKIGIDVDFIRDESIASRIITLKRAEVKK